MDAVKIQDIPIMERALLLPFYSHTFFAPVSTLSLTPGHH